MCYWFNINCIRFGYCGVVWFVIYLVYFIVVVCLCWMNWLVICWFGILFVCYVLLVGWISLAECCVCVC